MTVSEAYRILYSGALLLLAVLIGVMLIRSVRGPRITDRILSINMIGTMVIASVAILSVMLKEAYLADVALIYAMVSFVTVLILTVTYLPARTRDPLFDTEDETVPKIRKGKIRGRGGHRDGRKSVKQQKSGQV